MSNCCFPDNSSTCSAIHAFCPSVVCGSPQIKYIPGAKAPESARPSDLPGLELPARSAHENFLFLDRIFPLVLKIHLPCFYLPYILICSTLIYHTRFFSNRQGLFLLNSFYSILFAGFFFESVLYSFPCIYIIGFSRLFTGVRTGS